MRMGWMGREKTRERARRVMVIHSVCYKASDREART